MRTVSGYENQILIGHIRERNVVRKKAAVCGEERCVTSLKTAAKETTFKRKYLESEMNPQLQSLCASSSNQSLFLCFL